MFRTRNCNMRPSPRVAVVSLLFISCVSMLMVNIYWKKIKTLQFENGTILKDDRVNYDFVQEMGSNIVSDERKGEEIISKKGDIAKISRLIEENIQNTTSVSQSGTVPMQNGSTVSTPSYLDSSLTTYEQITRYSSENRFVDSKGTGNDDVMKSRKKVHGNIHSKGTENDDVLKSRKKVHGNIHSKGTDNDDENTRNGDSRLDSTAESTDTDTQYGIKSFLREPPSNNPKSTEEERKKQNQLDPDSSTQIESSAPDILEERKDCKPQHHILFNKVHKAGSTTVTNVLLRYAVRNELTCLLPLKSEISRLQNTKWVDILPPPPGLTYDILAHHSIYNPAEWRRLMPHDSIKIAILREPLSHLTSAIYFWQAQKIPGANKVETFLRNPQRYIKLHVARRPTLINPMSYELGAQREGLNDANYMADHALLLNKTYSLIMITQLMDESLVLLRRLLCWNTHDIIYITRNVNERKPVKSDVSEMLKAKHRSLSVGDYYLYDFFLGKLQSQMREGGVGFVREVKRFKQILQMVEEYCGNKDLTKGVLDVDKTKWNEGFVVTHRECWKMDQTGWEAMQWVVEEQYGTANRNEIIARYTNGSKHNIPPKRNNPFAYRV